MPVQRASAAEQIANELRAEIEAGTFKAGDPLPSDVTLASRFGVSKPTVTKARAMLVALGLVESKAGAASIVRDIARKDVAPGHRVQRARRTGRVYPEGHYARILRAELVSAPPGVATALGVPEGEQVIKRHRITYSSDDEPLSESTSYFPADLADGCPALLQLDRIQQGTTLYIEQQTGRRSASLTSTAWCRSGSDTQSVDAEQRSIGLGSCALALATTTLDERGDVLAFEVDLHPPDTPVSLDVTTI